MKLSYSLALLGSLVLSPSLHARTWTSSEDASKTFEAELVSYDAEAKTVTVRMDADGRTLTFEESKLSAEDVAHILAVEEEKNKPSAEEVLSAQVVGEKLLKAKLHRFDGKSMKKAELEGAPEYYILYFSASW